MVLLIRVAAKLVLQVQVLDSDWAYIQGKGKLTVGITLFAPMNYYNEKNELVGFDTEMAQAVAKKLGIDVEFSEINWDSKEVELNSKNIDCLWNGMYYRREKAEYECFSIHIFTIHRLW